MTTRRDIDIATRDETVNSIWRQLERLRVLVSSGQAGRARYWSGADVVISGTYIELEPSSFYPSPRLVVTCHASAVSWLFHKLNQVLSNLEDFGLLKEQVFMRLADVVDTRSVIFIDETSQSLLGALLLEASAIVSEIADGEFSIPFVIINDNSLRNRKTGLRQHEPVALNVVLEFLKCADGRLFITAR